MPSQKPRIALTMPPELHAAVTGMAAALEKPAATVLVDMLIELIPQLEGITKMALAAKSGNKAAVKLALAHMVGDNMAAMMTMQQPELFEVKKGYNSALDPQGNRVLLPVGKAYGKDGVLRAAKK